MRGKTFVVFVRAIFDSNIISAWNFLDKLIDKQDLQSVDVCIGGILVNLLKGF